MWVIRIKVQNLILTQVPVVSFLGQLFHIYGVLLSISAHIDNSLNATHAA